MNQGIRKEIDWAYIGALLANAGDDKQAEFFKSFVKECLSWGTYYQAELQLAFINKHLTEKEKELLGMLGYIKE